jgi:hypothetical protein
MPSSAVGPGPTFATVGFRDPFARQHPFALSLSKGPAELVEAVVPRAQGFDRLSPNGMGLSPIAASSAVEPLT